MTLLPGWTHRRTLRVTVVVAAVLVSGCGSNAASPPAAAPPPVSLNTVLSEPAGSWATLAMGHLDDPNNTFWEEFYRPAGGTSWSLRTPPGVADNGGLVAASTGSDVVIGVRPSNKLSFSPLASSTDAGVTWTPGLLPSALDDHADALTTTTDGSAFALTPGGVLASGSGLSGWHNVLRLTGSTPPVSGGCPVSGLSAVAATSLGPALGITCTGGAGSRVYLLKSGTLEDISPPASSTGTVQVMRLVSAGQGLAALLSSGDATAVRAAWAPVVRGPWTLSSPLNVGSVVSTSVTAAGAFGVLWRDPTGSLRADRIEPGAAAWTPLAAPPPTTSAIVLDGARTDALAVDVTTFIDYTLAGDEWASPHTIDVPIAFGSSG